MRTKLIYWMDISATGEWYPITELSNLSPGEANEFVEALTLLGLIVEARDHKTHGGEIGLAITKLAKERN